MAAATSAADLGDATAAGRWSTARFHARRASSKPLSPGSTILDSRTGSTWRAFRADAEKADILGSFLVVLACPATQHQGHCDVLASTGAITWPAAQAGTK